MADNHNPKVRYALTFRHVSIQGVGSKENPCETTMAGVNFYDFVFTLTQKSLNSSFSLYERDFIYFVFNGETYRLNIAQMEILPQDFDFNKLQKRMCELAILTALYGSIV